MDRVIKNFASEPIGGGLRWCESLWLAYQDDMSRSIEYDDEYFDKFAGYEGSAACEQINDARLNLVSDLVSFAEISRRALAPGFEPDASACRITARVFDIGIGSGSFLAACQSMGVPILGGFDVNPKGEAWLRERHLFHTVEEAIAAAGDEPIIFTLWDVLEHLREPHELFDQMRVGDSLCLTVPCYHALRAEVHQSKHYKPDEHYYYFTAAGLIRWLSLYDFQFVAANTDEQAAGREQVASFVFRKVHKLAACGYAPKRAFIVCGAESSGNRVLAAILCRAGCWGSGSTEQPAPTDVPESEPLVMLIRHHDLLPTYQTLRAKGFAVTGLLMVREWHANIGSLVSRGHDLNSDAAELRIRRTLMQNLYDSIAYGIPLIVTTYESLNDQSIKCLLDRLQLRSDNLDQPLELRGQERPEQTYFPTPLEVNAKHYA